MFNKNDIYEIVLDNDYYEIIVARFGLDNYYIVDLDDAIDEQVISFSAKTLYTKSYSLDADKITFKVCDVLV